jgi:CBS domain-containing protein
MLPDSPLPARSLPAGISVAQTSPSPTAAVTLDSPALDVMTDLTQVRAATTHPTTTLRQAEQIMIHQGVRMLFVVSEMPSLEGLITTTDLRGDRLVRAAQQRLARYEELCVADAMTPLSMLDAIGYEVLQRARVGNLIATLKKHGRNHLLVIEAASGSAPERVRGVISRAQIERQLGTAVEVPEIAHNFAEIAHSFSEIE